MHIALRKHELERIERENVKIAKKIYFMEAHVPSRKELADAFGSHATRSMNVARIKRRTLGTAQAPAPLASSTQNSRQSRQPQRAHSGLVLPPIN